MIAPSIAKEEKIKDIALYQAAVLEHPRHFILRDEQLREPQDDEVCVKLQGCGLCASSIPLWQGRQWFTYPAEAGAPGHEAWGIVHEVGKNIHPNLIGKRVALLSHHGFAEYDYVTQNQLLIIPDDLAGIAFPGEPLACAVNIFKRSNIQKNQTVAIIGMGFLGLLLLQLAKHKGAKVIALSRRSFALDMAKEMAADEQIILDDHYQIIEQVKDLTNGQFCDHVIECTGKEWPLNLAGELCKERGQITIAGYHQDGMRQVNIQQWNWKGLDVINAHERDPKQYLNGMQEALDLVKNAILKPNKLYTHHFHLTQINDAFALQEDAPDGYIKAFIEFN